MQVWAKGLGFMGPRSRTVLFLLPWVLGEFNFKPKKKAKKDPFFNFKLNKRLSRISSLFKGYWVARFFYTQI